MLFRLFNGIRRQMLAGTTFQPIAEKQSMCTDTRLITFLEGENSGKTIYSYTVMDARLRLCNLHARLILKFYVIHVTFVLDSFKILKRKSP